MQLEVFSNRKAKCVILQCFTKLNSIKSNLQIVPWAGKYKEMVNLNPLNISKYQLSSARHGASISARTQ